MYKQSKKGREVRQKQRDEEAVTFLAIIHEANINTCPSCFLHLMTSSHCVLFFCCGAFNGTINSLNQCLIMVADANIVLLLKYLL